MFARPSSRFALAASIVPLVPLVGLVAAAPLVLLGTGSVACVVPEAGAARGACEYPHCSDWRIDAREYVKNPSVSRREYWAVARNGASAYLFPRPDGFRTIAEECTSNGPSAELFRRYSLCAPASSSAEVARVNGMSVEDALSVSSFLHERLVFKKVTTPRPGVEPFPYLDDELAVCDALGDGGEAAATLKTVCERAFKRRDGSSGELGYTYTDSEIEALVPRLNTVYGVR